MELNKVKVVSVNDESLTFDNGVPLQVIQMLERQTAGYRASRTILTICGKKRRTQCRR